MHKKDLKPLSRPVGIKGGVKISSGLTQDRLHSRYSGRHQESLKASTADDRDGSQLKLSFYGLP